MQTALTDEELRESIPLFDADESIFDDDDDSNVEQLERGSIKVAREDIKLMNVVRAIVILFLLTVATIFGEAVFIITLISQQDNFQEAYLDAARTLLDSVNLKLTNRLWIARGLSTSLSLAANNSGESWPFVTIGDFHNRAHSPFVLSSAASITYSPKLMSSNRSQWEEYAVENYDLMRGASKVFDAVPQDEVYHNSGRTVNQGIYVFLASVARVQPVDNATLFPIWQQSPELDDEEGLVATMFNQASNRPRGEALTEMEIRSGPTMTNFLFEDTENTDYVFFRSPRYMLYYPLFSSDSSPVVGSVGFDFQWTELLEETVAEDVRSLYVVVENRCGGKFTFIVRGANVRFIGKGDLHGEDVDGYSPIASTYDSLDSLFANHSLSSVSPTSCSYRLKVFATADFRGFYIGNQAEIYRGIVLAVFLFVVAIFVLYDCMVERRQNRIVDTAARSDAIVRSLFPSNVRDRLYEKAIEQQKKQSGKETWKVEDGHGVLIETPKNRLKSFILGGNDADHVGVTTNKDNTGLSEPIADLFPNTTVLFADIAGFTAWSSEREPSQVFTLLETIYRHMDKAAKKLGVFKVETIGDCYVAATGIPDPQPDHAEIMVRFGRSCLLRIDLLTKELETQLGPGTAELSMRFGIHSGPVTAGVLRGQKARFQLFGDTMNTASRMESTGMKNKIQLSPDTADLLEKAGYGHWVSKRQDLVHVKGKGDMQTYWLLLGSSSLSHVSSMSADTAEWTSLIKAPTAYRNSMTEKKVSRWDGTGLEGVLGVTEIDDALQRLVDWNVDVLLTLLKRIVANRIASGVGSKSLSTSTEKQIANDGLVLDDVQMVIDLPTFDGDVAKRAAKEEVELVPEVKKELADYVQSIASGYPRNSFHNFEHCSHVILSANKLLKRIVAADDLNKSTTEALTSKELHRHTYGIGTDPTTHFAIVFSALIHDVGHPGVPNGQLMSEDPELAERYMRKCVAEQHSVDIAWELLLLPRFKNLRACIYQDKAQCKRFRYLIVNSVMATDIFDKELKTLRNSRWDMAFHGDPKPESALSKQDMDRKATIVIEHIIQASDVSHTMQHWYIYIKWNERLFKEMYFAFLNGRSEKDPSSGWFDGELWFMDNYVIPLARKLKECGVFGVSSDEYLTYALQNREEWEKKGKEVCANMKKRAEFEARAMDLIDTGGEVDGKSVGDMSESTDFDASEGLSDPVVANTKAEIELAIQEELAKVLLEEEKVAEVGRGVSKTLTREVEVPPGKLGIVIDTTAEGPVIHKVNEGSPLLGKLYAGDVIVAIDDISTVGMDTKALSAVIASRKGATRIFKVHAQTLKDE